MSKLSREAVSLGEKRIIISHHEEGKSIRAISRVVGRSVAVVHRIIDNFKNSGSLDAKPKTGRPRKTTPREDRMIVSICKKDRFKTASAIARELNESTNINVSRKTVSRRLVDCGFRAHVPACKPLITKKNKFARLQYAKEHVIWSTDQWEKVHFSDESKFNVFGSDGRQFVRRRIGERLSPKCVKKTVKHGGGSVMVWGSISTEGTGPLVRLHGKINSSAYKSILSKYAVPYMRACDAQPAIFMQDNAPCHTAKTVK